MSNELEDKVTGSIRKHSLIDEGDRLICAISGGPDSVCMLHILASLSHRLGITLLSAHVNYHTRGEDSDLDEQFCRRLAHSLGLPVFVKSISPAELESLAAANFQREARELRYMFFEEIRSDCEATKIAVGHTADDVAETSLMHMIRGSGISGLGGIYPRSGATIRPLIECSRQEIVAYLDERGLEYRTDRSNMAVTYLRNRVRNDLIVHLERHYNPGIRQSLARTAHIARMSDRFIACHAERLFQESVRLSRMGKVIIDLGAYGEADQILRYGVIRTAYRLILSSGRERKSLDYELVERADCLVSEKVGTRVDLKCGLMVERGFDELVIFRDEDVSLDEEVEFPGSYRFDRFALELSGKIELNPDRRPSGGDDTEVRIDFDEVPARCVVRSIRDGDRVKLLNAPGSRKLSDILIDRKIPRALRAEIPVLTAGGAIIWIVGVGIADQVKLTDQTERVLKLSARQSVIQFGDDQGT